MLLLRPYLSHIIFMSVFTVNHKLRLRFALLVGKILCFGLQLLKRRGSQLPGRVALKICPDFLLAAEKPKNIICITGTNGKTTASNITEDILRKSGYDFCHNNFGSNTVSGIASALLKTCSVFGRQKVELAVFEVDERSALRIFSAITPNYLLVTNLFRDSLKRNAHTEYILSILEKAVPAETKLILNADDLISSRLHSDRENSRVFFGVAPLAGEICEQDNLINDLRHCPVCGTRLEYSYKRYHHLGRASCPGCSLASYEADYLCSEVNTDKKVLTLSNNGSVTELPLIDNTVFNIYNQTAAVALLCEYGISMEKIKSCLKEIKITETRLTNDEIGGVRIINYMFKAQNPIAASRACSYARNLPGEKNIMLLTDDIFVAKKSTENMSWIYDSDFEFLCHDSVHRIFLTGPRAADLKLRLLLAGIAEENIVVFDSLDSLYNIDTFTDCNTFIIMHAIFMYNASLTVKKILTEKLTAEPSVATTA